jgi:molecular chaperone Hsp33
VKMLTDTVTHGELLGLSAEELLHRLYNEEDVRLFDSKRVEFRCSCSRDKVGRMLKMLGPDEVHAVLAEQGAVEVNCEFCNQQYRFDAVDAEQVFAAEVLLDAGDIVH